MGAVVGVLGGSGGIGASAFAAVLAACAASAVLVDLDPLGGGIDVLLGMESVSGARWSGVRVGGGRLDAQTLLDGLPRWGPVGVLAADVLALDPDAAAQVVEVAVGAEVDTVVLALPRAPDVPVAALCDLVVVVARGDVGGLVAAHAVLGGLPAVPVGVVVRRGPVTAADAAALAGAPLVGTLPSLGSRRSPVGAGPSRVPSWARRVGVGVLDALREAHPVDPLPAGVGAGPG